MKNIMDEFELWFEGTTLRREMTMGSEHLEYKLSMTSEEKVDFLIKHPLSDLCGQANQFFHDQFPNQMGKRDVILYFVGEFLMYIASRD